MQTFITACLLGLVAAGVEFGTCPENVRTVPNFDVDQYKGGWYEYQRDNAFFFSWFASCVTPIYTKRSDGAVDVFNR